jgi:hypothetical protein
MFFFKKKNLHRYWNAFAAVVVDRLTRLTLTATKKRFARRTTRQTTITYNKLREIYIFIFLIIIIIK